MKLSQFKIKNFRRYKEEVIINIKNLTAFIGKNDAGKSTILEAMDIFFNEKNGTVKIDKDDVNIECSGENVELSAVFEDFPESIDLDAGNETNLTDEYLLNSNGKLEIKKVFAPNGSGASKVFIIANHPASPLSRNLLVQKQSDYKKIIRENNIECNNLAINSVMRKAIRDFEGELNLSTVEIDASKEDAKNIWAKLSVHLPLYSLFQSDRSNSDSDNEVKDPMMLAVKEAISDPNVISHLQAVYEEVQKKATDISKATLDKLSEMSEDIANDLKPTFPENSSLKWADVFKNVGIKTDNEIKLNKRGSGIKRLILLNFFRAQVERRANSGSKRSIIYAIEEPETCQHPNHQKMLVEALIDLSESDNTQILLTTHSPALAQMISKDKLIFIENNSVCSGEEVVYQKITDTLGILPNPVRLLVFVEGKSDVAFLKNINRLVPELNSIIDLSGEQVDIIPLDGSNLKDWANKNYLRGLNLLEFHLYDRDADEKYRREVNNINSRNDGSKAILTAMLEIENYYPKSLIENEFSVALNSPDWANLDIPEEIMNQRSDLTESKIKKRFADKISHKINSKALLEETGAWEEIKSWFENIKSLYDNCLGSNNE